MQRLFACFGTCGTDKSEKTAIEQYKLSELPFPVDELRPSITPVSDRRPRYAPIRNREAVIIIDENGKTKRQYRTCRDDLKICELLCQLNPQAFAALRQYCVMQYRRAYQHMDKLRLDHIIDKEMTIGLWVSWLSRELDSHRVSMMLTGENGEKTVVDSREKVKYCDIGDARLIQITVIPNPDYEPHADSLYVVTPLTKSTQLRQRIHHSPRNPKAPKQDEVDATTTHQRVTPHHLHVNRSQSSPLPGQTHVGLNEKTSERVQTVLARVTKKSPLQVNVSDDQDHDSSHISVDYLITRRSTQDMSDFGDDFSPSAVYSERSISPNHEY